MTACHEPIRERNGKGGQWIEKPIQQHRRNEEWRYEGRQQVNYAAIPRLSNQRNIPTDQQAFQVVNTANTFTIKDVR